MVFLSELFCCSLFLSLIALSGLFCKQNYPLWERVRAHNLAIFQTIQNICWILCDCAKQLKAPKYSIVLRVCSSRIFSWVRQYSWNFRLGLRYCLFRFVCLFFRALLCSIAHFANDMLVIIQCERKIIGIILRLSLAVAERIIVVHLGLVPNEYASPILSHSLW